MRGPLLIVASCAGTVLASCSLLVSTDGLAGSPSSEDAAARDAGADASDASDASDGPRALSDAAFMPFVCPTNALVCDDFERSNPDSNGWGDDGTSPAISNKVSLSPTRSLAVAFPSSGNGAWIRRVLNPVPPRVRITFGLYAGTPATDTYEIVKVPYGDDNNWESFTLFVNAEGLNAATQRYDHSATPTLQDSKLVRAASTFYGTGWHAVSLRIDMRNNPRVMSVSIDGAAPTSVNITPARPTPTFTGLYLGATYGPAGKPFGDAYIDDVIVTPE